LDWFDATIHSGDIADSRFVAWLAQLQYAQRVWEDAQVIIRADIQLSSDKLLALEKFSLGGINTVRGYRENTLVRDQAILLSAELRYPLLENETYGRIELVPFIDYGKAWNRDSTVKEELLGIGIGLKWNIQDRVDAALYLAHDVKKAPKHSQYNLQDSGIHFRLTFDIF